METGSHDRILLKALSLFSERGYEAASVREICEAAGVTKPTLYHFYGSKEGVYRALVEGTLKDYREGVREIVEALHGSIRVASVLGSGTTFVVDLPLEQP